ncbi:MAG: RluA family pseudouridine synthase [Verrucomicrobiota bacterium]
MKQGLEILYQDKQIVVVNKPSGVLSVPGRGPEKYDSISTRVKESIPGCLAQPAVHRLDMDTSGILVLALTKEAHRDLSIQFQNRRTKKRYVALLDGVVKGPREAGTIELPFRLDIENRPYQIYDPIHGKMGVTHWRKIRIEGELTRVEFVPVTGRTHQLRVHASHEKGLGIPISGDLLYGTGTENAQLKLHAESLSFDHPETGETMTFQINALF